MKQKLLLIVIVLFLAAATVTVIRLNPSKQNANPTTEAMSQTTEVQETQTPSPSEPLTNEAVAENQTAERPAQPIQPSAADNSTTNNMAEPTESTRSTIETPNSDLWQSFEPNYQPEIFSKYQQSSVDRRYLKFARSVISEAKTGDTISVFIPHQNRSFYIAVDSIDTYDNGDITVNGWTFDELGIRHPVTITQGAKGTFGNIATPEGSFTLEVVGDTGWIAPTNDIRNQQNFHIPDAVVPKFDPETGKLKTAP